MSNAIVDEINGILPTINGVEIYVNGEVGFIFNVMATDDGRIVMSFPESGGVTMQLLNLKTTVPPQFGKRIR